jgi:uncharacterized membrane protein YphA (DoxX/SURF4 family)
MSAHLSSTQQTVRARIATILCGRLVQTVALVGLCSAYIQGPLVKILDFAGALAEMQHFGLQPAALFAPAVIVFELLMSALVISGVYRWVGALALAAFTLAATFLALRFWELPAGPDRAGAMNGFFEHLGLVGAFVIVAAMDLNGGVRRGIPAVVRN